MQSARRKIKILTSIMAIVLGVVFIIAESSYSHPLKYHKIRKLGVGHLTINIEGKEADMNFVATSLDIFGFEKKPAKTDTESLKVVEKFRKHVKANAENMVLFDPGLGCKTKAYILSTFVGEHKSEGEAAKAESKEKKGSYKMTAEEEAKWEKELKDAPKADIYLRLHAICKKPFKGKKIAFGLTTVFPKVAKIEMHLIDGKNSKGRFIKKNRGSITP